MGLLRGQGLRHCARRLLRCAADVRRSPSRRNKDAALARLCKVTPILSALSYCKGDGRPTDTTACGVVGSPGTVNQAHADLRNAELVSSHVLESWASCFLHLALCEEGGGKLNGWLSMFSTVNAHLRGACTVASTGPAMGYLLSAHTVQLAAALDGGSLCGLPEEVVRALPLLSHESQAVGGSGGTGHELSSELACSALLHWTLTLQERSLPDVSAQAAAQAQGGLGEQRSLERRAGCDAGRCPAAQRSGRGTNPAALLPYNTRALYGLCMRLARSGIAAWGGRPQGGAAGGSGASPAAAAASGSGALQVTAAPRSRKHPCPQPHRPLNKGCGMQLTCAALRCADAALGVWAARVAAKLQAAAQAAAAGTRAGAVAGPTGAPAVEGAGGCASPGSTPGPAGEDGRGGDADGASGPGGAGAAARGVCPGPVRLAALEEWVQVLTDACVLATGEAAAGACTQPPQMVKLMVEWCLEARSRAVRDLLRALWQAKADDETAAAARLDAAVEAVGRTRDCDSASEVVLQMSTAMQAVKRSRGRLHAAAAVALRADHQLLSVGDRSPLVREALPKLLPGATEAIAVFPDMEEASLRPTALEARMEALKQAVAVLREKERERKAVG